MTFGRSVDPIVAAEHAVTRMAVTTEAEVEKQQGDNRTMGRKFTIPCGLYRSHGFINAPLAGQTGFSDDDQPAKLTGRQTAVRNLLTRRGNSGKCACPGE